MTKKESRTKLTTYIDNDIIKQIKIEAIKENKSLSDLLNELIRNHLETINK